MASSEHNTNVSGLTLVVSSPTGQRLEGTGLVQGNNYTNNMYTTPKKQNWADIVSSGNNNMFNEPMGFMSQASSVMEYDHDYDHDDMLPFPNPQWEWVDHFEDGMVFVCTSGTFEESCKRMLLGLPKQYMPLLKSLSDRSHIFLFNKTTKTMHAGYHPGGEADWNICPQAFTPIRRDENGVEKRRPPGSKYPAQVPFAVFRHLEPLPEGAFKGVLRDPRKPKVLKRAHVRQLLRIFQKAAAPAGPAMPVSPPAFVKIGSPVGSDTEPAATHSRNHSKSSILGMGNGMITFLTPPQMNVNGRPCSPAASVASYNSPSPSVASVTPKESKIEASQKFKERSTDALKRLQNGNIRPLNHVFSAMHDEITTLQMQLQQQQLLINNLSFQLAQSQLQRMVPIYPAPVSSPMNANGDCNSPGAGAMTPPTALSPSGTSPPKIIPLTMPPCTIPINCGPMQPCFGTGMCSPPAFHRQGSIHRQGSMHGYFAAGPPQYHQPVIPTMG